MILDTIVAHKKEEVAELKKQGIRTPEEPVASPRGFMRALTDYNGVAVIGEAKKASPSKGVLCEDFDPLQIALNYKEGGVQAMSVLTDVRFFQGDLAYIPLVRKNVDFPVLRKDFIIDEIQIKEANVIGADAILLIAAILDQIQIQDYLHYAHELGMDVLVEVHDEKELEKSLAAGSGLIGINNRNLNDFSVDLNTTFRLKKEIPSTLPVVSESGIHKRDDMLRLRDEKVCAALIGERFMTDSDPVAAIKKMKIED